MSCFSFFSPSARRERREVELAADLLFDSLLFVFCIFCVLEPHPSVPRIEVSITHHPYIRYDTPRLRAVFNTCAYVVIKRRSALLTASILARFLSALSRSLNKDRRIHFSLIRDACGHMWWEQVISFDCRALEGR